MCICVFPFVCVCVCIWQKQQITPNTKHNVWYINLSWPKFSILILRKCTLTTWPLCGFLCAYGGPRIWFHIWPEVIAKTIHWKTRFNFQHISERIPDFYTFNSVIMKLELRIIYQMIHKTFLWHTNLGCTCRWFSLNLSLQLYKSWLLIQKKRYVSDGNWLTSSICMRQIRWYCVLPWSSQKQRGKAWCLSGS